MKQNKEIIITEEDVSNVKQAVKFWLDNYYYFHDIATPRYASILGLYQKLVNYNK